MRNYFIIDLRVLMSQLLKDYIKIIPHYILPKHLLTVLIGVFAKTEKPFIKNLLIKSFIRHFSVNMDEACEKKPENYKSFNEFFIRNLKPNCRKITNADIVSPVDGIVSEIGQIKKGMLLQAKKKLYSVNKLLACDPSLCSLFENGSFATLYLSPKDYHRVHMPIQGTLLHMTHIPGKLFSVQSLTTRMIPQLFAQNERLVVFFKTRVGPMALVLVGATIVGTIGTSWHGDILRRKTPQFVDYSGPKQRPIELLKGAEMGYFKLGSTAIILFPEGANVSWDSKLHAGSPIKLGQEMGYFRQGKKI